MPSRNIIQLLMVNGTFRKPVPYIGQCHGRVCWRIVTGGIFHSDCEGM
jgi:hypothetical protein